MSAESWVEVRALVPMGWEEFFAGVLTDAGCHGAREGTSSAHPPVIPSGMTLVRSHFPARDDSKERRLGLQEAVASFRSSTVAPAPEPAPEPAPAGYPATCKAC